MKCSYEHELSLDLQGKLSYILEDLRDEYCQAHNYPWIIGYSGGKDSTLMVHLVMEMLLNLPRSDRSRKVYIISNDTLVESPFVINHIDQTHKTLENASAAFRLPVEMVITRPQGDQTFWVNLIGRGYPSPSRTFRWCTDRLKISPTSSYIMSNISKSGKVILLIGVRRDESAARASRIKKYGENRLHKHNDLHNCLVYRPILDITIEEIWETLSMLRPPWGGSHADLIKLYRNADGGDCPMVTQKSDAPSCGSSSSRFGCWTCTVVKKDKSLQGFVDSGFEQFIPLIEFRDWLYEIRNDSSKRLAIRRGGKITYLQDGSLVPGPFSIDTRKEILQKLKKLEKISGLSLISESEEGLIQSIWSNDVLVNAEFVLK